MSYRQLTEGQRYQTSALLSEEWCQREIARTLNIAPSSIGSGYVTTIYPPKSQEDALTRRSKPKPKLV
ncbi:helix-turn-helix domain-containing protein [Idiomarina sp.]|uniref:helix-turn-helix domain-containing protein n=1 Tax=Idiomarina sp. TaxID=1874361 RepID=UPI00258651CF|nr:helix-turn-helix domain-containing protein [Idiomarina sp.]